MTACLVMLMAHGMMTESPRERKGEGGEGRRTRLSTADWLAGDAMPSTTTVLCRNESQRVRFFSPYVMSKVTKRRRMLMLMQRLLRMGLALKTADSVLATLRFRTPMWVMKRSRRAAR